MVKGCKPDGDKIMRVHAQSATMENGFVYLPKQAHWLDDYLHEMLVFPKGRHDDQVDSTAQAFSWAKQRSQNTGIIEYYARLAAEQRGEGNCAKTRLLVPVGITVYLRDGSRPTMRDGIIEVPESEAGPLVAARLRAGVRSKLRASFPVDHADRRLDLEELASMSKLLAAGRRGSLGAS